MPKAKAKVAIIEDEAPLAHMYRTKLESGGYQVETAPDGVIGLQLIKDFKPDIVLLDLMMPNVNGIDVMQQLRQEQLLQRTKVIVLTNMGDNETANQIYELGATDFIVKAEMTPKQVFEKIKSVLAKK